ncbi:YlxR family protein [Plantactinospora alkalitolerans]|uniref:YlxR family protein n=1 Tax=Plantactinospora alkalitolerans TaxID=2789879 RepID=UPI002B2188C6|nr:YlxR family protein [Plantactinospora alkalitolerans]
MGCRQRAPSGQLLRIVAVGDETGHSLRPDPTRRLPGRGANLHPDPACFTLALRRRAFGRALRIAGVPDASELAEHLQGVDKHDRSPGRAESTQRNPSKVGRPT